MTRGVLLVGVVALLLAAPAPATLIAVQITKAGFTPAHVTLHAGDSISWTNRDSGDHKVVCKTCAFSSLVLKSGDNYAFTFLHAGKFTIVDPLNGNKKETVTVKVAQAALNVTTSPTVVGYGKTETFSGSVAGGRANQKVEVLAQPCGGNIAKVVATVKTAGGGAFSYQTQPALATRFHARYRARTGTIVSSILNVSVRPLVMLRRIRHGKFIVRVTAGQPLLGKAVVFQRFTRGRKWVTSRVVKLDTKGSTATPLRGSVVSSAEFTTKLGKGIKVRVALRTLQALPCFSSALSPAIRS